MITVLKSKTPKAKKRHICQLCGCPIEAGQKYHRETLVEGGEFWDFICHTECDDLVGELDIPVEDNNDFQQTFYDCIEEWLDKHNRPFEGLSTYEKAKMILSIEKEKLEF